MLPKDLSNSIKFLNINVWHPPPPRTEKILRDSASSFHWLSISIFSVCRLSSFVLPHPWHLLSSPLYDVSEHTNHIFSVRIWSWQHVSVNISSVAELSPVYCCLVVLCNALCWDMWSMMKVITEFWYFFFKAWYVLPCVLGKTSVQKKRFLSGIARIP